MLDFNSTAFKWIRVIIILALVIVIICCFVMLPDSQFVAFLVCIGGIIFTILSFFPVTFNTKDENKQD
jgi:L-asparagine transporter-like permease